MKRILLADDSPIVRSLLKAVLIKHYELVEAEDGMDAFNKSKYNDIDLFLLDLNMPNMDGMELVKELKKDSKNSNKPIIMLTSDIADDVRVSLEKIGVSGFVMKSYESDSLLSTVSKFI